MTSTKLTYKKIIKNNIIPAAILIAAVVLAYFMWRDGRFLPRWITWEEKTIINDSGQYEIALRNKSVHIRHNGTDIWTSPDNIRVQDVISSDIDGDMADELMLLIWRVGRYGKARPFWADDNELENGKWSQHLFVYEYQGERIKPKWMSSFLGTDVAHFSTDDKTASRQRLLFENPDGEISAWIWDSWGFAKIGSDVSFALYSDGTVTINDEEPVFIDNLIDNKRTADNEEHPYYIVSRNGIDFAILDHTGEPGSRTESEIKAEIDAEINSARDRSDVVILFADMESENATDSDGTADEPANIFLSSGADIIIGRNSYASPRYETFKRPGGLDTVVFYLPAEHNAEMRQDISDQADYDVETRRDISDRGIAAAKFTVKPARDRYFVTDISLEP